MQFTAESPQGQLVALHEAKKCKMFTKCISSSRILLGTSHPFPSLPSLPSFPSRNLDVEFGRICDKYQKCQRAPTLKMVLNDTMVRDAMRRFKNYPHYPTYPTYPTYSTYSSDPTYGPNHAEVPPLSAVLTSPKYQTPTPVTALFICKVLADPKDRIYEKPALLTIV